MPGYIPKPLASCVVVLISACAGDSDVALDTPDPSTETVASAICTIDTQFNDALLAAGPNPFGGFSINEVRGPRDCGGTRVSRDVTKISGDGACFVVADGSFAWANELCASNPQLMVGNSTISAACQEFQNGGSDLGDHDCRYIVHAGAGPAFLGLQCQPSHVASIVTSCPSMPPPNDNFAAATVLSGLPVSVPGTTARATRETNEPDHYTENLPDAGWWLGDHSVWYQWTASSQGPVNVDVCTGAIDSIVAVYSGSTLGSLSRIIDNNNGNCAGGWGAKVVFAPTPGANYHIAVSDAGGARENTFTLKLSRAAPAAVCGNGVVENGEQCDDGNPFSFDHCSPDCQHACTGRTIWCDCTRGACMTEAACDRQCEL
jgi:cysteine-rich repeat protein